MMNLMIRDSHQTLTKSEDYDVPSMDTRIDGCAHLRRLTDSELIIDLNSNDNVSMNFDCSFSSTTSKNKFLVDSVERRCDELTALHEEFQVKKETPTAIDDATATTVTSSTSFNTFQNSKKRVSFGALTINEHSVELGGSGVPAAGPSISLAWDAESQVTIPSIESYEEARQYPPRRGAEMMQPKKHRVNMLLDSGYTLNQIRQCALECDDIRKQRTRTVQQVSFASKTKSVLKKVTLWKKKSSEGCE